VDRLELAKLEYLYVEGLAPASKYDFPNLSREIANSPLLFMQMLALCFRRDDDGTDPVDWSLPTGPEHRSNAATRAYRAMENATIIPGTTDKGNIDVDILRKWIDEVRTLVNKHGRAAIGEQQIGQLLSRCSPGKDGIWPREEVRQVFEELASTEISRGMEVGRYNSRGVQTRGSGAFAERNLAKTYHEHADAIMNEMPFTSRMLRNMAKSYERDAEWWNSDERVRKRLRA
jgi:hypothetical protein